MGDRLLSPGLVCRHFNTNYGAKLIHWSQTSPFSGMVWYASDFHFILTSNIFLCIQYGVYYEGLLCYVCVLFMYITRLCCFLLCSGIFNGFAVSSIYVNSQFSVFFPSVDSMYGLWVQMWLCSCFSSSNRKSYISVHFCMY